MDVLLIGGLCNTAWKRYAIGMIPFSVDKFDESRIKLLKLAKI